MHAVMKKHCIYASAITTQLKAKDGEKKLVIRIVNDGH